MDARSGPEHNPAALSAPDPRWAAQAHRHLAQLRARFADLPGARSALVDHIGSTAVPGLAAKPFLDLQVRILPLPDDEAVDARIGDLGYVRARGARADPPDIDRDIPRGDEVVPQEVWAKAIFVHEEQHVILHIRRTDSPWGRYTVGFRDWLRAHPHERDRYGTLKADLSAQNVGKDDYDDYTRAKTVFLDEAQEQFERWARG